MTTLDLPFTLLPEKRLANKTISVFRFRILFSVVHHVLHQHQQQHGQQAYTYKALFLHQLILFLYLDQLISPWDGKFISHLYTIVD